MTPNFLETCTEMYRILIFVWLFCELRDFLETVNWLYNKRRWRHPISMEIFSKYKAVPLNFNHS